MYVPLIHQRKTDTSTEGLLNPNLPLYCHVQLSKSISKNYGDYSYFNTTHTQKKQNTQQIRVNSKLCASCQAVRSSTNVFLQYPRFVYEQYFPDMKFPGTKFSHVRYIYEILPKLPKQ